MVSRPAPARQPSLRGHNLALVLGQVADAGPASRAAIAAATGLTKATVSTLVDALVAGGLLVELGRGPAAGAVGRPGSRLALSPRGPVGVGLEVNVDYLATCTVDLGGAVRQREVVVDDLRGLPPSTVLGRAAAAARRALDGASEAGLPVAGLAVAVPGLVDVDARLLRHAPNLGWRDVAVLEELQAGAGLDLPTGALTLDNEANLAALAELWCGRHRGVDGPIDSFLYVSGEVGVGAGIVLAGRLLRGGSGFAGELGHVPVPAATARAEVCRCGAAGCLELVAGQDAVLRAAGVQGVPRSGQGHGGPVGELVDRAEAGDAAALAAVREAGRALGVGVAGALNLLDLDTVILGGLYARLAPWLVAAVEAELADRVLASAWRPVRLLVSSLGVEAAVRGAATSVVRRVVADPAAHLAATGRMG